MSITFSDEAEELRTVVRRLLDRWSQSVDAPTPDDPATTDAALWATLAGEIGVAGILVPEQHGGLGLTLTEAHVVLEELGRFVAPVPMLGSAVLATSAVLLADDADAAARILPDLADGSRIAALAWAEADGRWPVDDLAVRADPVPTDGGAPTAAPDGDGAPYRLHGVKHHVLDGSDADLLLVAARTPDGPGLFLVDPAATGVTRRATPAMDQSRPLAVVELDDAPGIPVGTPGAAGPLLDRLLDLAAVALSAEQVGGADRALEQTVAYSREREQFERPIGSFQALKHRMADMLLLVESARSASYVAVQAAVSGSDDELRRAAGAAGSYCAEAYSTVAGEAIQLHGGIGFTWEHDAHRWFKRAHGSAQLFGTPAWHRARVADAVGIGRGPGTQPR